MKNTELWNSKRIQWNSKLNRFQLNENAVFVGSQHIASIQFEHYLPLLKKYCQGKLLDCGCGEAPYFAMLKSQVSLHYCVDWSDNPRNQQLFDEVVNLNSPFKLLENEFDCVLLSDVIAHVQAPSELVNTLSNHLRKDGFLLITTPFATWISAPPHEYYHPTEFALRKMCADAGLEIMEIEAYGGYPDVLLDTLNKGMRGKVSKRVFKLLASVVKKSLWYKKSNQKTKYSYPIGYTLVARKL